MVAPPGAVLDREVPSLPAALKPRRMSRRRAGWLFHRVVPVSTPPPLVQRISADVRKALEAKGHTIRDGRGQMGGFHAFFIDPRTGVLLGGSDLRKDGLAIGW